MSLPRDISGQELVALLRRHYGYSAVRQRGSHITLSALVDGVEHKVTVPNHRAIRVGTLGSILSDVAERHGMARDQVRGALFGS